MLRRHLIELGAGVAVGAPAAKLALLLEHLVELPDPSPAPLPSQLSGIHVVKVRDLARRLHEAGRVYGSEPEVSSSAAAWASKLLNVRGAEPVKRALMVAVAELHLEAGWAGGGRRRSLRPGHHSFRPRAGAGHGGRRRLLPSPRTQLGGTSHHGARRP